MWYFKISFYVNSHTDKLFITVGVVVGWMMSVRQQ
jgi:hypothetical protein